MQLAHHFESLSDEELAHLLKCRPDLAGTVGRGFGGLAAQAASRWSLARMLLRSDVAMLVAAEVVCAFGPAPVDDLLDWVPPADHVAFLETLDRLRDLGLAVLGTDGCIDAVGSLRELTTGALGLGRSAAELARALDPAALEVVCGNVGLAATSQDPAHVADELAVHLSRPEVVHSLLASAPTAAREMIEHMVRTRVPVLELASWAHHHSAGPDPRRWLVRSGLLLAVSWDMAEMPREVGVVLREGSVVPSVPFEPPAIPTVGGAPQDRVDAEGAAAAAVALDAAEAVLHAVVREPLKLRKDATLGVREIRRLAKAVDHDVELVAVMVEILAAAGILVVGTRTVGTDDSAGRWTRLGRHERWLVLVRIWADSERIPSFALSGDAGGGTRPALEPQHGAFDARAARRQLLARLAEVDQGRAVEFDEAWMSITWWAPNLWSIPDTAPATSFGWFVDEAAALGLVALDAPTSLLRALAADRHDELRDLAAQLLPGDQSTFVLQADLTALALGALAPQVAARLGEIADRDAGSAVPAYRFSETSLRRGFDRGWTPDQVRAFLASHALAGVPPALDYLVADVERRYGHLVVHPAGSVVVALDEAVLVEALTNRRTRSLGLTQVAPTVAVSSLAPTDLLEGLRSAGYLPVTSDHGLTLGPAQPGTGDEAPGAADCGDGLGDDEVLADLEHGLDDEPPPSWFTATGGRELTDHEASELVARLRDAPLEGPAGPHHSGLAERVRRYRRRLVRASFVTADDHIVELTATVMAADEEWVLLYDAAEHQVLTVYYDDLIDVSALEDGR